jgi:hypothetical protein
MNDYNSVRPKLILKEYGRNVQKLVEFVRNTEDKERRNEYAHLLVDLMQQINPSVKDAQENLQKTWDDMFIIAGFDIDLESPYPKPEADLLERKPKRLQYKTSEVKHKHYGRNVQIMIDTAVAMEDPEEKEAAIIHIGKLMKTFYVVWNKENIEDKTILDNIEEMSKGQLTMDIETIRAENLFDSLIKERDREKERERDHSNNGNNNNKKGRQQNNNRNRRSGGGSNNNRRRRN